MALVEFGSRAYVITPFTSDYDNLLLSMALIGDPVEFSLFPDSGTVIASALEESIEIFKAFDFLEASGNLMVIFTDGEDTTRIVHGRSLDDILKSAVDNQIPLFFVRTNYEKDFGEGIPDAQWRAAVEKTGGRYYVAKNEASLIAAIDDIDREAVGSISARQYTSQQPRFTLFAFAAFMLWTSAAGMKVRDTVFFEDSVEGKGRRQNMRTILIRLAIAIALAIGAWFSWSEAQLAARMGDATQQIATLRHSEVDREVDAAHDGDRELLARTVRRHHRRHQQRRSRRPRAQDRSQRGVSRERARSPRGLGRRPAARRRVAGLRVGAQGVAAGCGGGLQL